MKWILILFAFSPAEPTDQMIAHKAYNTQAECLAMADRAIRDLQASGGLVASAVCLNSNELLK